MRIGYIVKWGALAKYLGDEQLLNNKLMRIG
jgi:hypothetical protein